MGKKKEKKATEKELREFFEIISKLDPISFIGMTKILKVDIVDQEQEPLSIEDIFIAVTDKFIFMKAKPRKELLNILREAVKG